MQNILKPGKLEELLQASKDNVNTLFLRKSFRGQIIKGITLNNAMFSKCDFSSIYGSTFTNCNFEKCDFDNSDLFGINFNGCRFYACSFNNTKMTQVKFDEECKIIETLFNNIANSTDVTGIDPAAAKIVSESESKTPVKLFLDFGFILEDDGGYVLKSTVNPDVFIAIAFDPDMDSYRSMTFVGNDCYLTLDIDDYETWTPNEFFRLLEQNIKSGKSYYLNKNENPNEDVLSGFEDLMNKINKIKINLK